MLWCYNRTSQYFQQHTFLQTVSCIRSAREMRWPFVTISKRYRAVVLKVCEPHYTRPVTSLGHQGAKTFLRGTKFFKLCPIVSNQWFLTGEAPPPKRTSINFQGGASPYAPYKMESLIVKFTNKYICFYSLFKVRGAWNKGQLLEGGVVEKWLNHCSKLSNTFFQGGEASLRVLYSYGPAHYP